MERVYTGSNRSSIKFREGDEGSFDYIYDYYGDDDMLYKTVRLADFMIAAGKRIKSVWGKTATTTSDTFSLGNREMKKSHDYTVRVENYSEWYSYGNCDGTDLYTMVMRKV